MDIKNVGLAILVGAVVTVLLTYPLWIIAPLIGGVIAGFLTKNGSIYWSLSDFKPALVGLISGVLGALIVIIGIHFLFLTNPPTEGTGGWATGWYVYVIVLLFAGPFLGYIGGAIGGIARDVVKGKKGAEN